MIERELLADIGFVRGTGWDHEVWVYEGNYWVHFGNYDRQQWPYSKTHINGDESSRREFLQAFLKAFEDEIRDSMVELTEDW